MRTLKAMSMHMMKMPSYEDQNLGMSAADLAALRKWDAARYFVQDADLCMHVLDYNSKNAVKDKARSDSTMTVMLRLNQEYVRLLSSQVPGIKQKQLMQALCALVAIGCGTFAIAGGLYMFRERPNTAANSEDLAIADDKQYLEVIADNVRRATNASPLNSPLECSGLWGEIDEAIHSLCASVEVQEQFRKAALATVVHDIRSPLASIRLYLDATREGLFGELSESGRERASENIKLLAKLEEMTSELLELEKSRFTPKIQLSDIDLAKLVREAGSSLDGLARSRQISIEYAFADKANATIKADDKRIFQVLINLLSNAIKFSPKSSSVRIQIAEKGPHLLEVSVCDSGPGVSPALADRLFAKFENEARTVSYKGYGLGLNIAKSIVEQHGGAIGYENLEHGTRFWFTLPRSS
jgi:signal transduction histidine kinase